jgi:hypothetical protein
MQPLQNQLLLKQQPFRKTLERMLLHLKRVLECKEFNFMSIGENNIINIEENNNSVTLRLKPLLGENNNRYVLYCRLPIVENIHKFLGDKKQQREQQKFLEENNWGCIQKGAQHTCPLSISEITNLFHSVCKISNIFIRDIVD